MIFVADYAAHPAPMDRSGGVATLFLTTFDATTCFAG
jgi:hypothetical protein